MRGVASYPTSYLLFWPFKKDPLSRIIFPSISLSSELYHLSQAVCHNLGSQPYRYPLIKHEFLPGNHLLRPWSIQGHRCRGPSDFHANLDGGRAIYLTKVQKGSIGSRRLRASDCNNPHHRALRACSCV